MRRKLFLCSVLAASATAACGATSPNGGGVVATTAASVPIVATTGFDRRLTPHGEVRYVVTSVDGAELAPGGDLVLTLDDGAIGMSGGCNGIGGAYTLDGDVLVVDGLAQTEMACADALMAQDEWVVALLEARPSLAVEGDTVTISDGSITVTFQDVETARPDRPLEATTWWLTGTRGIGNASVPAARGVSVRFTRGEVLIDLGCQVGTALYSEPDVSTLDILSPHFTPGDCADEIAAVQAVVAMTLDGPVTVEVHADTLRIIGAESELELRAGDERLGDVLDGRAFESTTVEGRDLIAGTTIRLEFAGGEVRFWAGCNTQFAPYRLADATIVTAPLGSTAGGCQQALYDQDGWIGTFLASRPAVVVDGSTLTISSDDVAITLAEISATAAVDEPETTVAGS
jgi:heat shock protein HslJ